MSYIGTKQEYGFTKLMEISQEILGFTLCGHLTHSISHDYGIVSNSYSIICVLFHNSELDNVITFTHGSHSSYRSYAYDSLERITCFIGFDWLRAVTHTSQLMDFTL